MNTTGLGSGWLQALADLDTNGYARAVARFDRDVPSDDAAHRLWRSSIYLYKDELAQSEAELDAAGYLTGDLAATELLLRSEIALWRGHASDCEEFALAAESDSAVIRARAIALMARASLKRHDWGEGLERVLLARPMAEAAGMRQLVGILDHCEGWARLWLKMDSVEEVFLQAISAFSALRDVRWEAICRNCFGGWLGSVGRVEDAEREHAAAAASARKLGLMRHALEAESNLAQLMLGADRIEEAIELLGYLLEWERRGEYGVMEANSLVCLAYGLGRGLRWTEAIRAAKSAQLLASTLSVPGVALDAHLVRMWAEARLAGTRTKDRPAGAPAMYNAAVIALREARRDMPHWDSERRYRVALFLADSIFEQRCLEASIIVAEAAESDEAESRLAYGGLLSYVRKRMGTAPVQIDDEGRMIIDTRRGWPDIRNVGTMAEDYVFRRAMEAAGEKQSVAASTLGISRQAVFSRLKAERDAME